MKFTDRTSRAAFIVTIVTIPIVVLAIFFRFLATRRTRRKQSLEDWFAYVAACVHLAYAGVVLDVLVFIDGMLPFFFIAAGCIVTFDTMLIEDQLTYAVSPLFAVNQAFTKSSILLLYYRIFGVNRTWARWIYVIAAIVLAWFIALIPVYLFSCRPISKGWNALEPGTCVNYDASVAGLEAINAFVDFVMVILAFFMIRPLQTSSTTKLKLGLIFAVGALAGLVGIVKVVETYEYTQPLRYSTGLWTIVQMASSIVCCCAPTYKPILPTDGFFTRLVSNITSFGSRTGSVMTGSSRAKRSRMFQDSSEDVGMSKSAQSMPTTEGWLELGDSTSKQKNAAWAETSVHDREALDLHEGQKGIKVKKSVEVV